MHIEPTSAQLKLLTEGDPDAPVVMLNLLRFSENATGIDEVLSGRDAYRRYGEGVGSYLAEVGAELVWSGQAHGNLIGPDGEQWDAVLLVRYPSRRAFLEMVSKPGYREVARYRTAALDDSRLIPTTEGPAT